MPFSFSWWPRAISGTLREFVGPGNLLQKADGVDNVRLQSEGALLRPASLCEWKASELRPGEEGPFSCHADLRTEGWRCPATCRNCLQAEL